MSIFFSFFYAHIVYDMMPNLLTTVFDNYISTAVYGQRVTRGVIYVYRHKSSVL